jgi:pSer/pThr/pTyr-binding forkhead associated (FHA) protein
MENKKKIFEQVMPKAVLRAITAEAAEAVPQTQRIGELVAIRSFPFRIGRESRIRRVDGRIERIERQKPELRGPNNDLYLVDKGKLLNISREHLQIEKNGDGYKLVDRGSACGITIGGTSVGGADSGARISLRDGDIFGIGTTGTPYLYAFIVL